MKIAILDLIIIIDTMMATRAIYSDRFNYTNEIRKEVLTRLINSLQQESAREIEVDIT